MRLRASSGLTQPAWKTIWGPAIRSTMAMRYSAHSANRKTRGCDHRTIAQVPKKPTDHRRQILAGRSDTDGLSFVAGNVSSANEFALAS
jgi:hypothetical protein